MSTNPPDPPEPQGENPPDPAQPPYPVPPQDPQAQAPYPAAPQSPQYAPPPQYGQAPYPHQYTPPPPQPQGGMLWLGLLLGIVVPILLFILAASAPYPLTEMLTVTAFLSVGAVLIAGIVLTVVARTRRTGIGLLIGFAALPIIGFGVCVALLTSSGFY